MQIYLPFSLCILCVQTMHGIVLGIALQQLRQCYFKVAFAKEAVDRCLSFKRGDCKIFDSIRSHLKYAVYGWLNKIQPRSLTRAAGCHFIERYLNRHFDLFYDSIYLSGKMAKQRGPDTTCTSRAEKLSISKHTVQYPKQQQKKEIKQLKQQNSTPHPRHTICNACPNNMFCIISKKYSRCYKYELFSAQSNLQHNRCCPPIVFTF